jgi:hypothetical protein
LIDCGTISPESRAVFGAPIFGLVFLADSSGTQGGAYTLGPTLREGFLDFVRVTGAMLLNANFPILSLP